MTWLEPWYGLGDDSRVAGAMERELRRELGEGHPLYRVAARAFARRCDNDDVLFALGDQTHEVAVVHLVWQESQQAPWPATWFYGSLDAWVEHGMKPDHADYIEQT